MREIVSCVELIEEVLLRTSQTDWHDEWHSRVEEAEEYKDCLDAVAKRLREVGGFPTAAQRAEKVPLPPPDDSSICEE